MAGANNSFNGGQFDRLKLSVYFDSVDQNSGETVSRYPRHTQKSFRPSPKRQPRPRPPLPPAPRTKIFLK